MINPPVCVHCTRALTLALNVLYLFCLWRAERWRTDDVPSGVFRQKSKRGLKRHFAVCGNRHLRPHLLSDRPTACRKTIGTLFWQTPAHVQNRACPSKIVDCRKYRAMCCGSRADVATELSKCKRQTPSVCTANMQFGKTLGNACSITDASKEQEVMRTTAVGRPTISRECRPSAIPPSCPAATARR